MRPLRAEAGGYLLQPLDSSDRGAAITPFGKAPNLALQ